jgi:hypothetical protein
LILSVAAAAAPNPQVELGVDLLALGVSVLALIVQKHASENPIYQFVEEEGGVEPKAEKISSYAAVAVSVVWVLKAAYDCSRPHA